MVEPLDCGTSRGTSTAIQAPFRQNELPEKSPPPSRFPSCRHLRRRPSNSGHVRLKEFCRVPPLKCYCPWSIGSIARVSLPSACRWVAPATVCTVQVGLKIFSIISPDAPGTPTPRHDLGTQHRHIALPANSQPHQQSHNELENTPLRRPRRQPPRFHHVACAL